MTTIPVIRGQRLTNIVLRERRDSRLEELLSVVVKRRQIKELILQLIKSETEPRG